MLVLTYTSMRCGPGFWLPCAVASAPSFHHCQIAECGLCSFVRLSSQTRMSAIAESSINPLGANGGPGPCRSNGGWGGPGSCLLTNRVAHRASLVTACTSLLKNSLQNFSVTIWQKVSFTSILSGEWEYRRLPITLGKRIATLFNKRRALHFSPWEAIVRWKPLSTYLIAPVRVKARH